MISPIGSIEHGGEVAHYSDGGIGEITQDLYTALTDIMNGRVEDKFGWTPEL